MMSSTTGVMKGAVRGEIRTHDITNPDSNYHCSAVILPAVFTRRSTSYMSNDHHKLYLTDTNGIIPEKQEI